MSEFGVKVAAIRFLVEFYHDILGFKKIASFWYILAHWAEMRGHSSSISNYKWLDEGWELFTKISKAMCNLKKKKILPGNSDNPPLGITAPNH